MPEEVAPTPVLDGVKVVELAAWTFVPSAGAVLADWGAEVIKLEHPETGDPQRALISSGLVPSAGQINHFVEQPNRGKRSVGLDVRNPKGDVRNPKGKEILLKLIENADVFLTNLLPDSRRRLGIEPDDLRAVNPKLIYARDHGYGSQGPDAERGAYDLAAYWSRSGVGDSYAPLNGDYPPPQRPAFGDLFGGFAIASGVAAALFKRERTGQPSTIDVSLLALGLWQNATDVVAAGVTGQPMPKFDLSAMPNPVASLYRTQDGRYIAFVLLQPDRFWGDFCARIDRPDLVGDERFANAGARFQNRSECVAELRAVFESKPVEHWRKAFADFEGVWDVMQNAVEVHDDQAVLANGYLPTLIDNAGNEFRVVDSPVQFDGRPNARERAPEHGEHTELVLTEAGYSWDDLPGLKESGAIL